MGKIKCIFINTVVLTAVSDH